MADEKNLQRAKQVYQTLCELLDNSDGKYEKDEEKLLVHFFVRGEDIPVQVIIFMDVDRQLVRLLSPLPFKMSEAKRMEGAIATCAASYGIPDGNFDYNLADGTILFKMTACFRESQIGQDLFQYMICSWPLKRTLSVFLILLQRQRVEM